MTSEGLDEVLVLEDDVRFEPYFGFKLRSLLNELKRLNITWDLVYVSLPAKHKRFFFLFLCNSVLCVRVKCIMQLHRSEVDI